MQIRRAKPADYPVCVALEGSVLTSLTWQMVEQSAADRFAVEFRPSRLPRPVAVGVRRPEGDPLQRLAASDLLLVAELEDVQGYLRAMRREGVAWLEEVVVQPQFRRQGVATALIQAARSWAREQGLPALVAEVPSRHQPAICLLQACAFVFCGFDDHRYDGRDIVIKFALRT